MHDQPCNYSVSGYCRRWASITCEPSSGNVRDSMMKDGKWFATRVEAWVPMPKWKLLDRLDVVRQYVQNWNRWG